ncbi:MAG: glycosyltransferase family 4 protein, partial [Anaerolineae bacterium]
MRILHISPRFWPAVGGAEELLGQLTQRLAQDGHTVTVLTTDAGSADLLWNPKGKRFANTEEQIAGIQVRRFPVRHLPAAPYSYSAFRRLIWIMSRYTGLPATWLNKVARYTPWIPGMADWLAATDERYDLVMAMNIAFEPLVKLAERYAKRTGIPYACFPLTHLGAGAVPGNDTLGRFYTMRHQLELVKHAKAICVMTPSEGAFYQAYGAKQPRIHVVGSAINPDDLSGGDEKRFRERYHIVNPFIFSLGTLCHDKGTPQTLFAMRNLWRAGFSFDLVLAGAQMPDMRPALELLSSDERKRVHLLGLISNQDKNDMLAAGAILVMPSRTESFGTVYLEAWHYARPVIGALTWGVQDVIRDGVD